MITRIKSKNILTDTLINGYVYFSDGKITAVTADELAFDREYDVGDKYVSAGFIDMHTHGALGFDFSESTPEDIARAVDFHLTHGTTSILPTVTASEKKVTLSALENISQCMADNLAAAHIIGAHLEGPYFSPAACGAQNPELITPPIKADYEEFVSKYGHMIKRWSYAPELDENGVFCKYIAEHGIIPSAGHTDAKYEDMLIAREKGCHLVTHLYSCTSTITREKGFRHLGVIETAYLFDDIDVEIIADGKHLPPELIRLIYKLKGSDRICLVTDSLRVAGTTAKTSTVGTTECIIEDGVCKLLDRSAFAGSIATTDRLVRVCVKEAGIPLEEAVKMMTAVPARVLGVNKGYVKSGYDADLVVFDQDINISHVFVNGDLVK